FSSRRRHTRCLSDWSSDVCSSDLTRRASRPSTKRSSCRRSAAWSAGGRASAQVEACSLKVLDGSWRGSGKGADLRKVANPRESEIGRASCRERGGSWEVGERWREE